jgi:hypothetical protein
MIVDRSTAPRRPTQFLRRVIPSVHGGRISLYPLNLVADLNALLGAVYVGLYGADVSLAPDASKSPAIQSRDGDSTYYFFETQDLPLFGPLRTLGVPESLIDVVEPFFRVIVELGYDRSIPPWAHPARRLRRSTSGVLQIPSTLSARVSTTPRPSQTPASLRIHDAGADPDDAVEQDVSAESPQADHRRRE